MKTTILAATALSAMLTAASFGGGKAEARAYMPGGNWAQSCWNADIDGNTLSATCRDERGRARDTDINLRGCDSVENENGNLVCASYNGRGYGRDRWSRDDRGGYGYGALPAGAWGQSCRDASMRGGVLTATCQTENGRWRDTSLNVRGCGDVENMDGRLVCSR